MIRKTGRVSYSIEGRRQELTGYWTYMKCLSLHGESSCLLPQSRQHEELLKEHLQAICSSSKANAGNHWQQHAARCSQQGDHRQQPQRMLPPL